MLVVIQAVDSLTNIMVWSLGSSYLVHKSAEVQQREVWDSIVTGLGTGQIRRLPLNCLLYWGYTESADTQAYKYFNTEWQGASWLANKSSDRQEIPPPHKKNSWNSQVSLPLSQQPTACSFPEPDQCSPGPFRFLKTLVNILLHLILGPPNDLFPSGLLTKPLYAPILYMCYMPNLSL